MFTFSSTVQKRKEKQSKNRKAAISRPTTITLNRQMSYGFCSNSYYFSNVIVVKAFMQFRKNKATAQQQLQKKQRKKQQRLRTLPSINPFGFCVIEMLVCSYNI